MTDLKPCFCGLPPIWMSRWHAVGTAKPVRKYIWLQCEGMPPCLTSINGNDEQEIIEAWNRRAGE